MHSAVASILSDRLRPESRERTKFALIVSAIIHVLFLVALTVGPGLVASDDEPALTYVAVQITPVQALGVKKPEPPQPAPPEQKTPRQLPDLKVIQKLAPAKAKLPPQPKAMQPKTLPSRQLRSESREILRRLQAPVLQHREGSALGKSTGTSTLGAAISGLDNPDFVYSYYVDRLLAIISSNWRRPALGGEIESTLYFRIAKNGTVSDLKIAKSSGYNTFDIAGLRAVQIASPFPPLPQSYRHKSLGVNLILR
ncbi:MAG: TonB family protein [Thermoanaerobaculia bacterium]